MALRLVPSASKTMYSYDYFFFLLIYSLLSAWMIILLEVLTVLMPLIPLTNIYLIWVSQVLRYLKNVGSSLLLAFLVKSSATLS